MVHRLWAHLSTPSIAVYERSRGMADPGVPEPDLCRTVCLVWLRQALQGSVFPVDPSPANIGVSRDGRVTFHGGPYASLEEPARSELLRYLVAVAGGEVDEAAGRLEAALALSSDTARAALRRDIRQMAPFRDGYRGMTPEPRSSESGFTEEVLIHWRIAARCGAGEALTSFYRGFFTMACSAQLLLPGGRDVMAEALRDLRVVGAFREIQELVRPSDAPSMLESFAVTFMRMPEDVDRLLSAFAEGNYPGASRDGRRARDNRSAGLLCIAVALAAASIAAQRLASSALVRQLAAAAFLLAGLLVLWAAARPERD